jgi:hypothetical protein
MPTPAVAARIRGVATGLLTAALTLAAHGVGSAAVPSGPAVVALSVVAATIGTLATTWTRATQTRVLLCLLAIGQLIGHLLLSAVGHHHTVASAPPAWVMLAAHVVAIAAGAVLIAAGDRLCRAVSRTVLAVVRTAVAPAPAPRMVATRRADQPLRSTLLLAASVTHRGPPVGHAH